MLTDVERKIPNLRWIICGLLFFATTINYIDRNVISFLKQDYILQWPGWSELQYGHVVGYFQIAYALTMVFAGLWIDRVGIRRGLTIAVIWWSLAVMGHAISGTVLAFGASRILLGIGEAANFPASIKAVAEWFPRRERALATGIFNCGTNVGSVLAQVIVAWVLETLGSWRWAFIVTGLMGFVWLIFWLIYYRRPQDHPRVSKAELDYIQSEPEEKVPSPGFSAMMKSWSKLLRYKQTWAFAIGKLMTDPIWWVWLFWVPGFLDKRFDVKIQKMALPMFIIYLMAAFGSVLAGWLPAIFLKAGWSLNAARKTAMLVCALCVTIVIEAALTTNLWVAVFCIGMACAAHQGWSANIFTLSSDMFPGKAVGSVVGIAGCAGGLGGYVMANFVGGILNKNADNYLPIFIIAGSTYLLALLIIHIMVPRLEPVELKD